MMSSGSMSSAANRGRESDFRTSTLAYAGHQCRKVQCALRQQLKKPLKQQIASEQYVAELESSRYAVHWE
jgi:hypothetical protein